MKKPILIVILFVTLVIPFVSARTPSNVTDINEDGYIAGGLRFNDTANDIFVENAGPARGYVEFNISTIPDTAIIDRVEYGYVLLANDTEAFRVYDMQHRPSTSANATVFDDAANGSLYYSGWPQFDRDTKVTIELSSDAVTNFTANLAGDWFALGFSHVGAGSAKIYDEESANPSYLLVSWHFAADLSYIFTGPFFENGNTTTPINVTAAIETGNEVFLVNGTTPQYFPVEPLIFYWDLGGGTTRRVYSVGEENLTVTTPDDTFDTYTFTVRDFTSKLSKGDAYLEAWRIVAANDTLIERQIIDVHNEVPLNLVVGATYTLTVRYYDNSTLDWGFFVPGSTITNTIILRGVEITDQAYLVGNFLFVEITRPIDTQITVDYLTTRNTTIWSNVTVIIRGGAVVATQSFNNESYTYNLGGLAANTSYTVLVEGEHTLQTEWAYSRTFDGTETYPDVPNLETIFPMGLLNASNLISWGFVLAGGLTFSVIYRRASLIVMCGLASFFSTFGFADWNFYLLSLCWFFAVVVFLGSGEK